MIGLHCSKYEEWFAWYPVQLSKTNKWVWLKKIYRKKIYYRDDMDFWFAWKYTDLFGILKDGI